MLPASTPEAARSAVCRSARQTPVRVLTRAFLEQLFTSDAASSEIQLRQTMIWVLAFLATPGLFIMMHVAFGWEIVVAHSPAMVDTLLAQLGALFVTHSMVSTGFLAVLVWEGLSFDRDDAMVLGPLPVGGAAIVCAKLAALAALLVGASIAVNLVTAVPFALITGNHKGAGAVLRHLGAHLAATVGGAIFILGCIVTIRGAVTLAAGARLAAGTGSLLQFLFVGVLLWFLIAIPSAMSAGSGWVLNLIAAPWLPTTWFLGLFEQAIGSPRPEFGALARRALTGVSLAVAGAVTVTVMGFRLHLQRALAPPASAGGFAPVRVTVWIARTLAGRDPASRGVSEFILLTIARNRAQQAPVAINAAIGIAVVVAGLSMKAEGLASLMQPRTIVLWIPLVMAYWTAIGVRAAFFVPAELRGSWTFRVNGPASTTAYPVAVQAAMMAYVLPRTLLLSLVVLTPLLGWSIGVAHTVLTCAVTLVFVAGLARTVHFIPFTREYVPGHARLKTRWPLYAMGLYVFAYWPAQISMRIVDDPNAVPAVVSAAALGMILVGALGRWHRPWSLDPCEEQPEDSTAPAALNLASVVLRK